MHSSLRCALSFILFLCAACASLYPAAKFDPLPPAVQDTPAGAVIVSRDTQVEFSLSKAEHPEPEAAVVERVRVRITGKAGEAFAHWPLPAGPHASVKVARARLVHP